MTKKESVVHTPVVILKTVRKAPMAITSPELTCMSLNIYSLTPLTLHAAEVIGWFLPPKIFQHFSQGFGKCHQCLFTDSGHGHDAL